ncbi:hypothetical protein KIPB_002119, partial [Kipferlia bialata]
ASTKTQAHIDWTTHTPWLQDNTMLPRI